MDNKDKQTLRELLQRIVDIINKHDGPAEGEVYETAGSDIELGSTDFISLKRWTNDALALLSKPDAPLEEPVAWMDVYGEMCSKVAKARQIQWNNKAVEMGHPRLPERYYIPLYLHPPKEVILTPEERSLIDSIRTKGVTIAMQGSTAVMEPPKEVGYVMSKDYEALWKLLCAEKEVRGAIDDELVWLSQGTRGLDGSSPEAFRTSCDRLGLEWLAPSPLKERVEEEPNKEDHA